MKPLAVWATALIVLAAVNGLIVHKESVLKNGKTMHLALAPVDPRSLIQGDYMILAYEIERQAPGDQLNSEGQLVVRLDENRVAHFVRFHQGETLADGEHFLAYRNRGGMRLGAESFFFQEGKADLYEKAKYATLKVTDQGKSVLVELRGKNLEKLGQTD